MAQHRVSRICRLINQLEGYGDIRTSFLMLAFQGVDEGPISQELGLIRVCSNGVIAGLKRTIGFRDLVLL